MSSSIGLLARVRTDHDFLQAFWNRTRQLHEDVTHSTNTSCLSAIEADEALIAGSTAFKFDNFRQATKLMCTVGPWLTWSATLTGRAQTLIFDFVPSRLSIPWSGMALVAWKIAHIYPDPLEQNTLLREDVTNSTIRHVSARSQQLGCDCWEYCPRETRHFSPSGLSLVYRWPVAHIVGAADWTCSDFDPFDNSSISSGRR